MYQSGPRSARLKTVLVRKRLSISHQVFSYLLRCSSTETFPWSQSLKGTGMLVHVMMWTVFWNKVPDPSLNSAEVISLTTTMARQCRRKMQMKATRVILALIPV